jgi:acyl-CoA synthetase (AMP-forming)/AMP-acid ligase II
MHPIGDQGTESSASERPSIDPASAQIETLAGLTQSGRPEAVAILAADGSGASDYAQLAASVESLAGRLRTLGVERGGSVALAISNGPEFVQLLLAITSLGAAAAPLNPAYTQNEYGFYLTDLDPLLLLLPAGELEAARAAKPPSTTVVEVSHDSSGVQLSHDGRAVADVTSFEPARADDEALLLHTSGTTSRPKQVPLTHRNLLASAAAIASHYRLAETDVSYCAMPLFHVHGLVASTIATLLAGGTVVVPRRLSRRRLISHLAEHRVSWFSAGPTLHRMLLEDASERDVELPHLRFLRSCSSPLPPTLLAQAEAYYGVPMLEAYGMTEASHQISSNPLPPAHHLPSSVGIPTGTQLRIVDSSGAEVGAGLPGEVQIKGPGVTGGYLNNAEANEQSFADGWFRTGDIGVLDNGYLSLKGRLKEMIIRGGENVSPAEVEEILLAHPAVIDAACFGVPNEKYGEEVAAAVSLAAEASADELIRHCSESLTRFKVPKTVYVVDAIPRTPTGKLQRRRVATLLLEGGG